MSLAPRGLLRRVWARMPAPAKRVARPAVKLHQRYEQLATIVWSGTFDQEWYEAQRGRQFDSRRAAIVDYLRRARDEYLSPHPLFEPVWFDNDWESRRLDPLVWFLRSDAPTRRSPHPLLDHWMLHGGIPPDASAAARWVALVRSLSADTALTLAPDFRAVRWGELRSSLLAEASKWRRDVSLLQAPRLQTIWNDVDQTSTVTPVAEQAEYGPKDRPLVSVVIPTWNRASLVARAIASVQAQTFSDFEVIVVDDGSTDDTVHVLRGICEFDQRMRAFSIDHAGVSAARNHGIAEARGELVAFLDTDNTWEPGYLQAMITVMQRERWDLAHAVLRVEDGNDGYYRAFEGTRDHLLVANYIDLNVLMVRATLLRKVGGFEPTLRRVVDWDLVLRLSLHADLHLVPVVGAVYAEDPTDDRRITVSELFSWGAVVRARHLIDWDAVAARTQRDGRVTVALPLRTGLDATVRWIDAVREEQLAGRDVELCMVSSGAPRAHRLVAASLAHVLPSASLTSTPKDVGFAVATDLALANATGSVFISARPSLQPMEGWLPPLLDTLGRAGVAAVQSLVLRRDGTVGSAGGVFAGHTVVPEPLLRDFPVSDVLRIGEVFSIPAALDGLVALRTSDAVACRGLDPLLGNSMADVDLTLRLAEAGRGATVLDTRSRLYERAPGRVTFGDDFGLAARVLTARWASPPPGSRGLWESAGFIVDGYRDVEITSTANPGRASRVDLRRYRPPATVHEHPPRLRWAIDTAAPAGAHTERWGDTHFARALARALTELDQDVAVDASEARHRDTRRFDDVVLVLRGLDRVQPSPAVVSLLWVISHPEAVDERELRRFDRSFAASPAWAARTSASWGFPVRPLLQCTDPELFNPDRAEPDTGPPVLFVGSSRRVERPVVRYAVAAGADVWIYGQDWEELVDASYVRGQHVANQHLGALYASARIVLNDHWEDMRRDGFLSNRLFDAVACGARVVSDDVVGIGEVFGEAVRTVDSQPGLEKLLRPPLSQHFLDRDARLEISRRVMLEHSFARRADELLDAASRVWFQRQREPNLRRFR
jgi:hypothetical protein